MRSGLSASSGNVFVLRILSCWAWIGESNRLDLVRHQDIKHNTQGIPGSQLPDNLANKCVELHCMPFATISEALEDLKVGKMIVVVDDPDRENEGDLIMPGETCTPEAMNFM